MLTPVGVVLLLGVESLETLFSVGVEMLFSVGVGILFSVGVGMLCSVSVGMFSVSMGMLYIAG